MIGIVDYGMSNVGSLINMIERLGGITTIITGPEDLKNADRLILPGVGSFDKGITRLRECNLWESLNYKVLVEKTPILCICLGMQLITKGSEEGVLDGLGWIDGECLRFSFDDKAIKIPHMGWNSVEFKKDSILKSFIPENPRFYFVHSYYVKCNQQSDVLSITHYDLDFISMIEKDNIYATQFHPEKSHKYGMGLIKSFIELC
jgi:imidazole glycerol-phosphate synthase subunit HisH